MRRLKLKSNDILRFWSKVKKTKYCWEWQASTDTSNYGLFRFKGKLQKAHRFSYFLHFGVSNELCVLHKCDNTLCVNPDHLFLGTRKENNEDRDRKNRHIKFLGSGHPCAKLTDSDIIAIRREHDLGSSNKKEMAVKYKINYAHLCRIIRRASWKHL